MAFDKEVGSSWNRVVAVNFSGSSRDTVNIKRNLIARTNSTDFSYHILRVNGESFFEDYPKHRHGQFGADMLK
jgi:hypothetical protein